MIILLNGTSSSGKSSIARELQQKLPGPYIIYARDSFHQMLPPAFWQDPDMRRQKGPGLFHGFHMSIAAFARAGVPLIVDHVINQPEWVAKLDEVLSPFSVLKVGVRCPLAILEQRERDRGNRDVGLARSQFDIVHHTMCYDLEVDTSLASSPECADQIITMIKDN